MTRKRPSLGSPCWAEASLLLGRQPHYRQCLGQALNACPRSGLYEDDDKANDKNPSLLSPVAPHDNDNNHDVFAGFVDHVVRTLSRSPRTVLRQALDEAFRMLREGHNKDDQELMGGCCDAACAKNINELLGLLGLSASQGSVHAVVEALERVKEGQCYRQLQRLQKQVSLPLLYETNPGAFRERIAKNMKHKQKKTSLNDHMAENDDDEHELDQAVAVARDKERARRQAQQTRLDRLNVQLQTDPDYVRYRRVQQLWRDTCEPLWTRYNRAFLAISKTHNVRGHEFERSSAELCFAMVALQHSGHGTTTESMEHDDNDDWPVRLEEEYYSYETNAHWWCNGERVGEIDLVVFCRNVPVAICEMKRSMFEISRAPQQHEPKIRAAANNNDEDWRIGGSGNVWHTAVPCPKGTATDFFVATAWDEGDSGCGGESNVPSSSASSSSLGADPVVVNAICRGIRDQNARIAHPSTVPLCRPVAKLLLLPNNNDAAILEQLRRVEPIIISRHSGKHQAVVANGLDYDKLWEFVRKHVPPQVLAESPQGCFARLSERVLVIPSHNDESAV